jgi:prolyl-tRNA editing enzyme YbaK/EbsC (Cys-tRNA(Pro) deacylase)/SAM-dependent methyltransferase
MTNANRPNLRHDILVGVGSYDDPQIAALPCCENDIELLALSLGAIPATSGEPSRQTVVTTRGQLATCYKANLLSALENSLEPVSPEDTVLLALSCHGLVAEGRNYLLPADAHIDNLETLIPFAWVKELLQNVNSQFRIVLVDACHSGDATITLKREGFRLGFDEGTAVADLLRSSKGVAYASACTHDQYAYLEPDEKYSVWMHNIATRLETLGAAAAGEVVLIEDVLPEAALQTSSVVESYHGRTQTPFYAVKVEGVVPLGLATGSRSRVTGKISPREIARATLQAFEHRFHESFGTSMPVEFDTKAERVLEEEGYPLSRVIHVGPRHQQVRLAVMFDSMLAPKVHLEDLHVLQSLAERHALDRLIVPREVWHAELRRPASQLRRLHLLELRQSPANAPKLYRDFFVAPNRPEWESVRANENADVVLTQMGKLFHIVLADIAAPTYDADYSRSAFGTERAMLFEEEILGSTVARLTESKLAVDLGCGTGRHTFQLAKRFERVIGYDFSSGMIEEANRKKRQLLVAGGEGGRMEFEVRDIEDEPPDFEPNSVDLVVGCFGMGSFLEDLVPVLAGVKEQLRPGGQLLLSFYNADALVYHTPPPWRDTSLSATLVPGRDELEVTLPTGEAFRIFCKPYRYALLKSQLSRLFDSVRIWSCPAFSSFLPNDFFSHGPQSELARRVIGDVDHELARRSSLPIGAYFTAVCTKGVVPTAELPIQEGKSILAAKGEAELLRLLTESSVEFGLVSHARVRNIDDVRRELGVDPSTLAKAILVVVRAGDDGGEDSAAVLVLQGSRRIDPDKVSALLHRNSRQWRFATQKEVKSLYGLEIGGVPPFGYSPEIIVIFDSSLVNEPEVVCGIGNPLQSVRLSTRDLVRVAKARVADIAAG